MFETNRLLLREYRPADEPFFLELFNSYDVLLNMTPNFVAPNHDRSLEYINSMKRTVLFVVAESKKTGVQLGFVNVHIEPPQNLDGSISIALAKDWWGKGYGTEIMEWLIAYSFTSLGLRRLSLKVFASNPGAIALYEHVGFKHEGRQREAVWKEGKWVDFLMMGMLSREYQSLRSQHSQNTPVCPVHDV
ncbi:hypothetical protein HYPSUDRAFT_89962 [Hypholoma sublateritium FD-334 SS-4]|uniref:N-acetyltransferase domain-containing protein n=1 Tax=Hypholoma sublateritium (strain FD-334 SS-4) TaxID=945553 RepID=A0A0D2PE45_HYPSF|nr:hypothetical protein HYPSUDRAFT_89962 [Hypholoma sublateritium FD-334 SS-4]